MQNSNKVMTNINKIIEKTTTPIVVEIIGDRTQRFVDRNDPIFDRPLSDLNKDYSQNGKIILVTKLKSN